MKCRRPESSTKPTVSLKLALLLLLIMCEICPKLGQSSDELAAEQLLAGASEPNLLLSSESHKIVASGWPSTSPMWPTIDTDEDADGSSAGQEAGASAKERQWFRMIEPFIYADKPRTGDYSLLLKINNTVLEALRAHLKPMSVSLSFEYYFNHDSKSTALPLIKIEVNRKELKYLDPSGQNARARRWTKFSERIPIVDLAQLEKPDWLKISLVNRDVPSIVAIRRLQAEFRMSPESNPSNELAKDLRAPPPPAALPAEPPPASQPPAQEEPIAAPGGNQYILPPPAQQPPAVVVDEGVANELPPAEYPAQQPGQQPLAPPLAPQQQPQELAEPGAGESDLAAADQSGSTAAGPQQDLLQPAASDTRHKKSKPQTTTTTAQEPPDASLATSASELLSSTIKPVTPAKKKGWGWPTGRRRRRRDTSAAASGSAPTNATAITLTCQRSDQCEWLSDTKDEGIQWSLARMPTLTSSVQAGYYYVSNRDNYGDSSKLLRVSLNQTERATIADQNSDHCIDLAVYVTERTFLRMYQLTRAPSISPSGGDAAAASSTGDQSEADWIRGSLLLSWAPTMAINDSSSSVGNASPTRRRLSLAGSRLAAMESGQNGWTMETLCFGDFFARAKECGAGKCAFGFIMDTLDGSTSLSSAASTANNSPSASGADKSDAGGQIGPAPAAAAEAAGAEQVVGVSILREYSRNVPLRGARPKWLETWQRNEVEPGDGWRFYPKLDFQVSADNVSMVNLFDEAHYFVESDWLHVDDHLDLTAIVLARDESGRNLSHHEDSAIQQQQQQQLEGNVFTLRVKSRLVDSSFRDIFANETSIDWNIYTTLNGSSSLSLNMSITEQLRAARGGQLRRETANADDDDLFKVVLEFVLDLHWLAGADELPASSEMSQYLNADGGSRFSLVLANVSVSDRCFPNPCEHGSCQQNGTGSQDWNCKCDDKYRGRRCEFGHWCSVAHVAPWNPAPATGPGQKGGNAQVTGQVAAGSRTPKLAGGESGATARVTGEQFCRSKLGQGYKCTNIDLPLNDNLYTDEDKTFYCSCRSDFYLADDSRCRPAHACNSVLCPAMSMICDESKPFNHTQPCHCNEKQDWFPNPEPTEPGGGGSTTTTRPACVRRQCHDKQRDCGFDAHLCIPTVPGERPICKCGPKFALKTDERTGKRHCQSTACVLPTLNDCQQICVPDNSNTTRPYTCACHPGYQLDSDNRSCKLERTSSASSRAPTCKPACPSDSQICTDHGCRCKQGFVGEGEVKVRRAPKANKSSAGNSNSTYIDYTESIRCLNICSLSYAENKEEFEMVESVCPLGLCDPSTFQCRCSDPSSVSLANEKYEPIYANCSRQLSGGNHEAKPQQEQSESSEASDGDSDNDEEDDLQLTRVSPLCHLKRVCEPDSSGYKICKSQGAICVPDYTKPTKFDCVCPPSTEKRLYGQGSVSEFSCESKCSAKRSDCLRKQAVCKQVDRDQVRCECLPGFMLQDSNVCYLAKYSYSMNLIVVNKYYEPEARFHRLLELNSTSSSIGNAYWPGQFASSSSSNLCPRRKIPPKSHDQQHQLSNTAQEDQEHLNEIVPQFNKLEGRSSSSKSATKMIKSIFIPDYNQCNITQIIPKSLIDDPYEHDFESYMGYIEQCNEKIHQNMRNYQLNSRLSEDVRQSLRQHLRDFTVTTNSSSCVELDSSGMLLNCTIYLQSNDPIDGESTINSVFGDCDKNAHDDKYCWIKPRLLLMKKSQPELAQTKSQLNQTSSESRPSEANQYNFKQIVPCEINSFCGPDAISTRLDDKTSLCSCKCPADVEVIDVKDLEPRRHDDLEPSKVAIKEICAPRNLCGANSTHCILKTGSVCQYDIRTGSRCICVYPSYEDSTGRCVEVAFSQLDNTLIIIIIMLGTALLVSVFLNILVAARTKSMFGRSKQYPLNEFSSPASRPMNRSTGVPNPVFEND